MQLHIFDDLTPHSSERSAAKNVIMYSLHLDYQVPKLTSITQSFIEDIFNICDKICSPLFYSDSFCFFGSDHSRSPIVKTEADLSRDKAYWKRIIKHHCVISSIYTIRKFYLEGSLISPFHLASYGCGQGYEKLKELNYIQFPDNENPCFKKRISPGNGPDSSGSISNFTCKAIPYFKKSLSKNEETTYFPNLAGNLPLHNCDLIYRLINAGHRFTKLHSFLEGKKVVTSLSNYIELSDNLENILNSQSDKGNDVDSIILRYQYERYYNLSLIGELLNQIRKLYETSGDLLDGDITAASLVSCFTLPNVFSRHQFLSYAFSSYLNDYMHKNFFDNQNRSVGIVEYESNKISDFNRKNLWIQLFKKFNDFFSKIVFPTYEKCFLLLLLEQLELLDFTGLSEWEKALEILGTYLTDHKGEIIAPQSTEEIKSFPNPLKLPQSNLTHSSFDNDNFSYAEKQRFCALLNDLLKKQANIIRPIDPVFFDSNYWGISSSKTNSYHRQLITIHINAALDFLANS